MGGRPGEPSGTAGPAGEGLDATPTRDRGQNSLEEHEQDIPSYSFDSENEGQELDYYAETPDNELKTFRRPW